jgi:integrase
VPWRKTGYRNWRRRVFRPPVQAAGLEITRPYDLRHAFASLLIREGRLSLAEIAEQMGNILAARAHREKGACDPRTPPQPDRDPFS